MNALANSEPDLTESRICLDCQRRLDEHAETNGPTPHERVAAHADDERRTFEQQIAELTARVQFWEQRHETIEDILNQRDKSKAQIAELTREIEDAKTALSEGAEGILLKTGLGPSIQMWLHATASTREALLTRAEAAEQQIADLTREIAEAREHLPACRRQHLLDAPLIDVVRETVSHICIVESQREELRQRLAILEAREGWQPIDTAPKDGTIVLGFEPHEDNPTDIMRWIDGAWRDPDTWEVHPTHWMPLPLAPSFPADKEQPKDEKEDHARGGTSDAVGRQDLLREGNRR